MEQTVVALTHDTIENLDSRAMEASRSRNEAELLIEEFRPFLHSCVSKYTYGRDDIHYDDQVSVAMLAFYEAIQSYDSGKGHFFSFASVVVKRRLIDGVRKKYRTGETIPLEPDAEEDGVAATAINEASLREYSAQSQAEALRTEIELFKAELATWDITMDDLYRQSPKQEALRRELRAAVHTAAQDPEIMQTLLLRRYLPIKGIAKISKVPPKKLDRARKYIIGSLLVLSGEYECMADYILGK